MSAFMRIKSLGKKFSENGNKNLIHKPERKEEKKTSFLEDTNSL